MRLLPLAILPFVLTIVAPSRGAPAACEGAAGPAAGPRAAANDNRVPAGRKVGDTLVLSLVMAPARWYPEGERGCALAVIAFAEEGRSPSAPGPLVRVPAGTPMRVTVRNAAGRRLWVRGFEDRPQPVETPTLMEAGAAHTFVFRATTPGTYGYRATMFETNPWGGPIVRGETEDAMLGGAFVVDEPGAPAAPGDRVFVLGRYALYDTTSTPKRVLHTLGTVNGRSWPYTERLTFAEGDSVHWRVINISGSPHPMHLHGFYFRLDARGRFNADSVQARPPLAVTEVLGVGTTMRISWKAERAGNWLFHCHLIDHMAAHQRLDRLFGDGAAHATHAAHAPGRNHAEDDMAGLVMGIQVRPRPGTPAVAHAPPEARRTLHLFADERVEGPASRLGFVLQDGARPPARDSVRLPGSPLILRRGEPVRIVVTNRLRIPLSVHWHGMELESFYDGVGDWSGSGGSIAPPIAPGDSFAAYFTPPRAGTFMYHVHGHERGELAAGLYGPMLVYDDPAARDTTAEQVLVVADGGPRATDGAFVNGSRAPAIALVAGRPVRVRIIGILSNLPAEVTFLAGRDTLAWRVVARDGAELATPSAPVRALHRVSAGSTLDVEMVAPARDDVVLRVRYGNANEVGSRLPGWTQSEWMVPVRVMLPPVRAASSSGSGRR